MAIPSASWGIEIGQFAIKAIRLERNGDEVQVTDFSVVPHRKVLSTPDIDIAEVTRMSLGQLISKKNLENEHLVISIPGHSAFARFAKIPPVEPKQLPEIIKFEAVQQIPFPIEDVEWDYEAFREEGSPEVEVGIFAITRDRVNERLDVYGEVGLSPETLTLSPVSLFNAMNYDLNLVESDKPLVFIDIGTQATDVIIATGNRCWIRTFPLGGTHFTEAIASSFKISYAKAERLKLEAASSKYAKQIMQAMRPVFADLLQELQRSLSYASSSGEMNHMVGVGSTFKIPGLRKFIGQQLQVNVTRLDEFKKIDVAGKEAASFAEHCVNMGTAYGLALQGVGLGQIGINLVPSAILREHMWHSKTKWFVAAACIVVAGSALSILGPFLQQRELGADGVPSKVTQVIQKGEQLKRDFSKAEENGRIGSEASVLLSLFTYRDVWPYIVQDAADSLASAGPDSRTMGLASFLNLYPDAKSRPLLHLHDLHGDFISGEGSGKSKTNPKISISMDVDLSHDNPANFIHATAVKWLKENALPVDARSNVPYKILIDTISCNNSTKIEMNGPEHGLAPQPSDGGGVGGGGRGGRGGGVGGGGRGGGVGGGQPGDSGDQGATEGMIPFESLTVSTMNTLAPLPEHTESKLHPQGESWYRILITFEVEILPQPRRISSEESEGQQ